MTIINKTIPVGLIIAVTTVLLPASVLADDGPVGGSIPSSIFDTDNDGLISKEEFNSVFTEFDKNADGKLNREEMLKGRRELMDKRYEMLIQQRREMRPGRMGGMMPTFSDCDLNGDGKIPEDEFNQAREKRMIEMKKRGFPMKHMADRPSFSDIDSNGDGVIDEEEFKKHQSERFEKMQKQRDMMWQKRREMHRGMGPGSDMPGPRAFYSDFDLDGDGKVTEKEFNEARAKRIEERKKQGYPMKNIENAPAFSEIDANSDGSISEDELYDMQTKRRQQMLEKRREMMMQERDKMRQSMGSGRGQGRGMGRGMPEFSEFDADGDGKITEKELNLAREKRISERARQGYPMRNAANAPAFSDIDANGDGGITEEEFSRFH